MGEPIERRRRLPGSTSGKLCRALPFGRVERVRGPGSRGITSYVQQRVEGWRTGSRASQAFLLLVLVLLVGVAVGIGALAQVVVPVALWFLFLMVGLMLLRFVPLLLLTVVLGVAAFWTSVETGFAPRPGKRPWPSSWCGRALAIDQSQPSALRPADGAERGRADPAA